VKFLAARIAKILADDNLTPVIAALVGVGVTYLAGRAAMLRQDLDTLAEARESARTQLEQLRAELGAMRIEPDPLSAEANPITAGLVDA
jgi:cell division protein FtsB